MHIQEGSGEKLGQFAQSFGTIVSGFVIGFLRGPLMAAIMLIVVPCVFFVFKVVGSNLRVQAIEKMMQNAKLGKYTEEQMSSIKLVIAFGREEHALTKYEEIAAETRDICKKTGVKLGYLQGLFILTMIGT